MIMKLYRSFWYSINGLIHAYRHDKSFYIEVWSSLLFIAFIFVFWPLEYYELLFVILSYILILIAELINTAFERALERLHPERHELIGASKDIASAAVLMAVVFAGAVAAVIAYSHIDLLQ